MMVGKKWELETETVSSAMAGVEGWGEVVKARKQRHRPEAGFSSFVITYFFSSSLSLRPENTSQAGVPLTSSVLYPRVLPSIPMCCHSEPSSSLTTR